MRKPTPFEAEIIALVKEKLAEKKVTKEEKRIDDEKAYCAWLIEQSNLPNGIHTPRP
jgi:hypothetical protein